VPVTGLYLKDLSAILKVQIFQTIKKKKFLQDLIKENIHLKKLKNFVIQ